MLHALCAVPNRRSIFQLTFFACAFSSLISPLAADTLGEIRVQGSGSPPQIGFACCDQGVDQMQSLLANPNVIASLRDLHAEVAIPILDFTSERAIVVRQLNRQQIPVIAWMMLPKEQGLYLTADDEPDAAARVAAFEKWSDDNQLKWAAVGLDIEPNFTEFRQFRQHRWRAIATLLGRSFDSKRIARAQERYSALIRTLQAGGYEVQTYQMPYLPAERSVHSTLIDRMLGTVDVRGNEEYLMLYTSYARPVGAAMIWSIGPHAQSISVGVTDGSSTPGSGSGPLNWNEFSRDLIVASHFSRHIGVYNLEGCVRQGFLPLLQNMDWGQSVTIPAQSVSRAERLGLILRVVLWIGSNLIYLLVVGFLFAAWLFRRSRMRKQKPAIGG
jgi:hypothetical protein